jgi:hypothetical protein
MRATFKFRTTQDGTRRWLRMDLAGEGWPDSGWAIEYSYLESQGLLPWFHVPPAESEGMLNNRAYEMTRTSAIHEIIEIVETGFAEAVRQTRPDPPSVTDTSYTHSVDLT